MPKKQDFMSVAASKPTTAIYYKPSGASANSVEQRTAFEACRSVAASHGIHMDKSTLSGGLPTYTETSAESDLAMAALMTKLGNGDTLIVASPTALGRTPSAVIKRVEHFLSRGVRLLCASIGGEINLPVLRQYVEPFKDLEARLADAEQALVEQAEAHAVEMQEAIAAHQQQFLGMLDQRGLNLADLMGIPAPDTSAFDRGRELRKMRAECGLTLEAAGQLCEPLIAKGSLSKFEQGRIGGRFAEYEVALTAHAFRVRQKADAEAAEAATDRDLMRRLNDAGLSEAEELAILDDLQKSISETEGVAA